MSRWPEPVREPLSPRLITTTDVDDARRLIHGNMTEPEDPAWNATSHGALYAAFTTLSELDDVLRINAIDRRLHGTDVDRREWERIGQEYVVNKVAWRMINELRTWLPLTATEQAERDAEGS